jgi:hypothetical protein
MTATAETVMTSMTEGDRRATQLYAEALGRAFKATVPLMTAAKAKGNTDAYASYVERCRAVYRELQEVEHALKTGLMPFVPKTAEVTVPLAA